MAEELISKQQVCEVLAKFAPENYTALVEMLVVKLPAVDAVEVVHGYNTGNARWFECSVCGYGFNDIFLLCESDDMLEPKYCAHCGAKMDGERREEDG